MSELQDIMQNEQAEIYKSKGEFNDRTLSARDKKMIEYYKELYNRAKEVGDIEGMENAHLNAEKIRKEYGYSGGQDGSEYIPYSQTQPETEKAPQNAQKNVDTIDELKRSLLSKLFAEYEKSVKNIAEENPYDTEYAKQITNAYSLMADNAAKQEAIIGMGENSGNFDSFAAANANRQKLSFVNAANEQIQNKSNEKKQKAYDLYKELVSAIAKL